MRTVLSMTARRRALLLALAVGLAGAVAVPASAASHEKQPRHNRSGHASVGGPVTKGGGGPAGVRLGPAVKYVRDADGTVRRVR